MRDDSYRELARIAQTYYSDNGFCAVIATAKACRCSFGKAFNALKREGRRVRTGTHPSQYHQAIREISGKSCERFEGFEGRTIADAETNLPRKGTFLIRVRKHVACMVDGKIYDWTARTENNGKASRRRIISVHVVK
jgi:hypothetical protein